MPDKDKRHGPYGGRAVSALARHRIAAGLTQQQLADILGVCNVTISRWECGDNLPPTPMLIKLAELYHCSIDNLLI